MDAIKREELVVKKRELKKTLEKLLEIAMETKDVRAGLAVIDYLYKEE